MPDYANGKIYKIEPLNGEEGFTYIGSTTKKTLAERMTKHRSSYKLWKEGAKYYISSFILFEMFDLENCRIYLIENFPCNSIDELRAREGHYIKTVKCVNKCVAGRTKSEYAKDNEKKYKEYHEKYRNDHKLEKKEYMKQYYKDNVEEKKQKSKEYREAHQDKYKEYLKDYHQKHKEARSEKNKLNKFECTCGTTCRMSDRSSHLKSIKHQNYLENLQNPINI